MVLSCGAAFVRHGYALRAPNLCFLGPLATSAQTLAGASRTVVLHMRKRLVMVAAAGMSGAVVDGASGTVVRAAAAEGAAVGGAASSLCSVDVEIPYFPSGGGDLAVASSSV